MAENNTLDQSLVNQPDAIKTELDQLMAVSLNGGFEPTPADEENKTDAAPVASHAAVVADPFTVIKEKFSYNTAEDAVKEIEELRRLRDNPAAAPLAFENDSSKKIFEALSQGKEEEVYQLLESKRKIDKYTAGEITKENADDVIKLGMELKYKDLTREEINYRFNKQFQLPKPPVALDTDEEGDFEARKREWAELASDMQMNKIIEAKLLKPELEAAKIKLVYPAIDEKKDADYLSYKQSLEESQKANLETVEAYKLFTPKALETRLNFTDETSKIQTEFAYEPDEKSFQESVAMVSDFNQFFNRFVGQDGKPERQKFLKAIHFALNMDKIIVEAMKQSKNATIKASLPDNSSGGLNRQTAQTQEPSELDINMRASLAGHMK